MHPSKTEDNISKITLISIKINMNIMMFLLTCDVPYPFCLELGLLHMR